MVERLYNDNGVIERTGNYTLSVLMVADDEFEVFDYSCVLTFYHEGIEYGKFYGRLEGDNLLYWDVAKNRLEVDFTDLKQEFLELYKRTTKESIGIVK